MTPFDLIAIGGGTAGFVTAAGAASLGLRAAPVEREALGGDCLWTGCVPTKALSHVVYPYPTMVEGVKRAAGSYYREQFAGRTGEWLRKVVRWLK